MLFGKLVNLIPLRFKDCSEDRQLRSSPSNRLQSLRSSDTKELKPANVVGNRKLMGSKFSFKNKQQQKSESHDSTGRPLHPFVAFKKATHRPHYIVCAVQIKTV
jgi:hypothetical protein